MTRLLRSFCVAVTLLCLATWANALLPVQTGWQLPSVKPQVFPDKEAACSAYQNYYRTVVQANVNPATHYVATSHTITGTTCNLYGNNGAFFFAQEAFEQVSNACPANSTAVQGGCQCNPTYDESGGQCVPHVNQCTAKTGQVGLLNWTEGYTRTPDEGDRQAVGGPVSSPPSNGEVCDGGCKVSLQLSGPGVQPYVSQAPTANGLYRRSVDYPSLNLGTECTMGAADAGAKKDLPPPECPGSVGEVGGRTVCVGTAAKPVTTAPLGQPPATPVAGNPAAGPKPSTGEGAGNGSSGRTPTSGNGTATGGPAAAATGGKGGGAGGTGASTAGGMGEGEKPTPCGAPGQPICAVKVDETGVAPNAGTTFDASKTAIDQSADDTLQKINAARDRTDGPAWSFTFALPTGCSPYPVGFGGVTLNVCQYQGTIHDLLSMVWAAVTAFTIIGMVGRTIRGT